MTTTGWLVVTNGWPAVAVCDGCVWMTSWLGTSGLRVTVALPERAGGQAAAGGIERDGPAGGVGQVGEVGRRPRSAVMVSVPLSVPAEPLASPTVTGAVEGCGHVAVGVDTR